MSIRSSARTRCPRIPMTCLTAVGLLMAAAANRPLRAQGGTDSAVVRQSGTAGGSLVTQLTTRGANALNDFDYRAADSLARTVLNLGVPLTPVERRSALQLLIASLFPDDPPSQKLDSAKIFIKQYVESGAKTMPANISWRGLDSLVALFARPAVPAVLRVGSRVPGAVLYINGQPQGVLDRIRALPVPSGSAVTFSVRADQCANVDSSIVLNPSDSLLLGYVNPVCAGSPPTWPAQAGSIVDDLLQRADNALNRLDYGRADSLARNALAPGSTANDVQREHALFVVAAAAFPDDAPARQHRADAMEALEQIVRTDIDARVPWEFAWPGIVTALADAKTLVFGIGIRADSEQILIGPDGMAAVSVHASRPARFVLRITPAIGGTPVVVDSVGPSTDTTFRFSGLRDGTPVFLSADYDVAVTAHEASGDSITVHRVATVVAPMLVLQTPPAVLDSSKLLPERSARYGWRGIFTGLLLGGGAYALGNYLRADSVRNHAPVDGKAMPIAIGLTAAVLIGSVADPGRPVAANIAANARLHAAFDKARADVVAANRESVATYRTLITFHPGIR